METGADTWPSWRASSPRRARHCQLHLLNIDNAAGLFFMPVALLHPWAWAQPPGRLLCPRTGAGASVGVPPPCCATPGWDGAAPFVPQPPPAPLPCPSCWLWPVEGPGGLAGWFSAGRAPAHSTGSRVHGGQQSPCGERSSPALSPEWAPQGRGDTGPSLLPCTPGQISRSRPLLLPECPQAALWPGSGRPCAAGGDEVPQGSSCTLPWSIPAVPTGSTATRSLRPCERSRPQPRDPGTGQLGQRQHQSPAAGLGTLRWLGTLSGAEPPGPGQLLHPQSRAQHAPPGAGAGKFRWDGF